MQARDPAQIMNRIDEKLQTIAAGNGVKRTYVLVHGAWHGGWVWRDVIVGLRAMGHRVTAPTLTGLGERRHTAQDTADLEIHIEDIVAHIEMEDLQNVALVGWSYGGVVTTGVSARIPDKIKSMIYLDAYVPENGKALIDYVSSDVREMYDAHKDANIPVPPLSFKAFGLNDQAIIDFVKPRLTSQPWRTLYQPVKTLTPRPNIPITYICCTGWPTPFTSFLEGMKKDPKVATEVINTNHYPMLAAPMETIDILINGA
jgi:pimeloyl-ACP methyl ester carboxylesterase